MKRKHGDRLNGMLEKRARLICACVLVMLLQTGAGAFAEDAAPESESTDYINLLKNGGFEEGKDGAPADWRYYGGSVPGDWELSRTAHEGKQGLRLRSDKDGYHGGFSQHFAFEGNRKYKISAWVKANISDAGKLVLLYNEGRLSCVQNGQTTNKSFGGSASVRKTSFDWEYIEKTFETPVNAIGTCNAPVYPFLFYGPGEVWVDDMRLVDLGPVKLGKEVYSLTFDDPKIWKLSAHVNEEPAEAPEGVLLQSDAKNACEGKPGLKLRYVFTSAKHDAVLLTADASIAGGTMLALRVYGDGSGHELDAVLYDKSGEAHYLPLGLVYWRGWKTVYKSFADLIRGPESKWDVSCEHWGGDKNQTLELPITRVAIGLNDQPDGFKGKGEITFGWLKIYE
ncbi:MAG: carbohydrate binding domain-containing protein [Kiritimatiellae bacterium]|nr:carbohydrate binding domain-containing protein [Kiritimatiellia bacterium]